REPRGSRRAAEHRPYGPYANERSRGPRPRDVGRRWRAERRASRARWKGRGTRGARRTAHRPQARQRLRTGASRDVGGSLEGLRPVGLKVAFPLGSVLAFAAGRRLGLAVSPGEVGFQVGGFPGAATQAERVEIPHERIREPLAL